MSEESEEEQNNNEEGQVEVEYITEDTKNLKDSSTKGNQIKLLKTRSICLWSA